MTKCLDEAVIQAYMDGELEAEAARRADGHFAECAACAEGLASAEGENLFFAEAFGPAPEIAVPTEALRARVKAAVARLEDPARVDERGAGWNFGTFLASLSGLFSFTPQRAAAFASVLAVVVAGLVFLSVQKRTGQPTGEQDSQVVRNVPQPPAETSTATPAPQPSQPERVEAPTRDEKGTGVEVAAAKPQPSRRNERAKGRATSDLPIPQRNYTVLAGLSPGVPRPTANASGGGGRFRAKAVPGEEKYQEVIASLEKVVKLGGETVLAPQARFEYERNLAVLDRAIEETRRVALRDPKDRDAVGFLMSAYQSKVELLSTVADQTQVASVGR